MLHYVIRTRESVILDDALAQNPFSADEYICQKHARSVLCLPLVKQAKLIGVLYLENNLASHVFTPARISVLELLASQAAISLENARLYSDLQEREAALQQSEAYLAQAQELSRTGSFGWSVATDEIIWSEETFQIFRCDRETKPTLEFIFQRTHPEDRAAVQKTVDQASRDGKDFDHEYRLLMPDGSVKYVHAVARAATDASANIEFVGAVTDVTAAKEAERKLRRSEAYLAEAAAFESYKQLGMGCATSRVRVSVARSVPPVWFRSGKGRCAAAGVPGSYSPRRQGPQCRSGVPGYPRESGFRS